MGDEDKMRRNALQGCRRRLALAAACAFVLTTGFVPVLAASLDTRAIEQSVVRVFALVTGSDTMSTGTGWLISGQRIVVTNNHVIESGTGGFRLGYLVDGKVQVIEAKLVRRLPEKDLAILEAVSDLPGRALALADYDVELASKVIAVGFPGTADMSVIVDASTGEQKTVGFALDDPNSYRPTWTEGVVSRQLTRFPAKDVRVVQHSAAINHGNSGGPLFDPCGRVVGVNTFGAVLDQPQGVFYSIHPSELVRFLEAASFRPERVAGGCVPVSPTQTLMPMLALTLLLSAAALAVAYNRRVEVVMKPLSAVVDRVSRVVVGDKGLAGAAASRLETLAPRPGSGTVAIRLEPLGAGRPILIDPQRLSGGKGVVLGRSRTCDVILPDDTVSRRHARLWLDGAGVLNVEDLSSSGGTWRGGERVQTSRLRSGDSIRLGQSGFRVVVP